MVKSHILYKSFIYYLPGYKIIEVPKNIIYFPVKIRNFDVASKEFADKKDRPIGLNGEKTTTTCHIKKS